MSPPSPVARHVLVRGAVQGVGFRHFTKLRARELGLAGFVRNLPDGGVEVWAEGPEALVQELIEWLRRGPPAARVDGLAIDAPAAVGYAGFAVRFA